MTGVLALIPARGGSKGVPRKNIRDLAGKPLIVWSIEAGRRAEHVDRVVVSTDDPEIAEVASAAGAEVPFLRPAELAADDTRDLPVFEHALQWLEREHGYSPEIVVHLRPTSPIRPVGLVDEGIDRLLAAPEAQSLRAVCEPSNNPFKMWTIDGGHLQPLVDCGIHEQYNQPRQALPTVYWQTGTLDVVRRSTILEGRSMTGSPILPMIVDASLALDIDDPRSLQAAAARMRELGLAQ